MRRAATANDRASFGSFLFTWPVFEQPHPCGELGLHVHHVLACSEQLLREQLAEATGGRQCGSDPVAALLSAE